ETKTREPQAPEPVLGGHGVEGGNRLAGDKPGLVGDLVDDAEPALDPVGRVDERRHDRHPATEAEEPVAVRRMVPREAPDAADGRRAARSLLAEPANQLDVERAPAVARLLARVHRQLLPDPEPGLVPNRKLRRLGEQTAVPLADADALERHD